MPDWHQFVFSFAGLGLLGSLAILYRERATAAEREALDIRLREIEGGRSA